MKKTNGKSKYVIDNMIATHLAAIEETLGHEMSDLKKNGSVLISSCIGCLGKFVFRLEDLSAFGTVLEHPCDGTLSRTTEFPKEAMSEAHRALISGPWQHPALAPKTKK